jgi:hypothetical protein
VIEAALEAAAGLSIKTTHAAAVAAAANERLNRVGRGCDCGGRAATNARACREKAGWYGFKDGRKDQKQNKW